MTTTTGVHDRPGRAAEPDLLNISVSVTVNGEARTIGVEPRTTLLEAVRLPITVECLL